MRKPTRYLWLAIIACSGLIIGFPSAMSEVATAAPSLSGTATWKASPSTIIFCHPGG